MGLIEVSNSNSSWFVLTLNLTNILKERCIESTIPRNNNVSKNRSKDEIFVSKFFEPIAKPPILSTVNKLKILCMTLATENYNMTQNIFANHPSKCIWLFEFAFEYIARLITSIFILELKFWWAMYYKIVENCFITENTKYSYRTITFEFKWYGETKKRVSCE